MNAEQIIIQLQRAQCFKSNEVGIGHTSNVLYRANIVVYKVDTWIERELPDRIHDGRNVFSLFSKLSLTNEKEKKKLW